MRVSIKQLIALTLSLLCFNLKANAIDFKHFTVNQKRLENYKTPAAQPNSQQNSKYYSKASAPTADMSTESPLMNEVREYLNQNHSSIKAEQLEHLYQNKRSFNLGLKNHNGLSWQKLVGDFTLITDRVIEPNQYVGGKKWVVSDVLIISIDAKTYLTQLKGDGVITIGESELGAFAGLTFRRIYTHKYYTDNYDKSLEGNFDKLLLSFLLFEKADISRLMPSSVVTKEDVLGFKAGGLLNAPLQYGLSLSAGFLIKTEKTKSLTITSSSEADIIKTNQFLTIDYETSKQLTAGAELSLKLDFFNLLKLTLLKFEYLLVKTESKNTRLAFSTDDVHHFISSSKENVAIKKLLKFKGLSKHSLTPFIQTEYQKKSRDRTLKMTFLNVGSASQTSSEQVIASRANHKGHFIKHQHSEFKYKKGWKDALYSMALQSLINFDLFQKYLRSSKKSVSFEYQKGSSDHFTLELRQERMVAKTHRSKYKKYKYEMIHFINNFTLLPPEISEYIQQKKLIGPIKVKAYVDVSLKAINYFNHLSPRELNLKIENICDLNPYTNRRSYSRGHSTLNRCVRNFNYLVYKYKKKRSLEKKLWVFKALLNLVNKYSRSYQDQISFFGEDFVELRGVIEARTPSKTTFKYYYNSQRRSRHSPLESFLSQGLDKRPTLVFHQN